ncbi:MAG: hypothetical protein U5O16_01730 [Rhodococcus sp. (in: high G+C Gram-positive bacteria)]|uniref:hypothetical protein n=1 Tax=Rhodococcus sp. TaxID=1831 RepID=UPI002ADAAD15|nr:hypothetical protein [Rhodococcus sp. (in: high G+C Gram-positive bacteria)]
MTSKKAAPLPACAFDADGYWRLAGRSQCTEAATSARAAKFVARPGEGPTAALPPLRIPNKQASKSEQADREEKRRQLIKLLAEIERRINMENSRPKKRYISPAVREEVYAVYYDGLRRAIEDRGTDNFPQSGGKKLYGELTMIVTVNFDGKVLATEVVQKPTRSLDRRKPRPPFNIGAFKASAPPCVAKLTNAVVSRSFTRAETVEATVSSSP